MCGTCGCGSEENGVNIRKPGEIAIHEHHEHEHHHHDGHTHSHPHSHSHLHDVFSYDSRSRLPGLSRD